MKILQAPSEVYGDPSEHPQKETYWDDVNAIGPRFRYDKEQHCVEMLYFDYHRQHGLKIRVERILSMKYFRDIIQTIYQTRVKKLP